ncbi:superoxide dismutase [Pyrus ussuriensis x Pyrus communis]|uniref:superoxide dismutase n=1 Tax=Pyrus ussuriensis x Pyrus communis TaxID=2448454 RepID=A0A5N5F5X9_9ROSA|nr:superoxide dismutase [Fe], chloroplastic [Pyrus x bretschneideri]KAB2598448.1 superoxide dismutase [Pyrus ussuriensis x Pyrus communis]
MVTPVGVAAAATAPQATTGPLTCALGPSCQGLSGSLGPARSLQWPKKQRKCRRKVGAIDIRAQFELKPPPYPLDALEPHMSKETLEYHWGKHHRGYVDNLNKLIAGTELGELSLEDVILATYNKGDMLPPFNQAAQIWNHDFFWESMKPGGGGKPSGELLELINRDFGSFERLIDDLRSAATTQLGSGWAWLAYKANRLDVGNAVNPKPSDEDKKLVVVKSPNAVNPLIWDYSPLLTIDVWEHAYYLDFQNRRADYLSIFMEKLVSWEAVSSRLEIAKARATEREEEEERKKREEAEKTSDGEVPEIYVDNKSDDSETE